MFWPIGILAVLTPVLVLILVIGIIVLVLRRGDGSLEFSFRTVVSAYLVLVMGVSLVVAAAGVARVGRAVFADVFGRDFSYRFFSPPTPPPGIPARPFPTAVIFRNPSKGPPTPPPGIPARPPGGEEREQARVENLYRDDLVYGVTMLAVGLLVFGVHAFGRRFLRQRGDEPVLIQRAYLVLMTGTTSVVALASLVAAIAGLARRYVLGTVGTETMIPNPGGALATTLVFSPLWLWFLFRIVQEIAARGTEAPVS